MKINVPFNDTSRIYEDNKEALQTAITEVAKSGWWLLGKQNQLFSEEFANYCNTKYCVLVANGTDALELAIKSIVNDSQESTEIITVANAGGYSSIACRLANTIPVYADINPATLLIDIDSIIRCLSPSTKAVILTHLFGAVVNVHKVRQSLNDNGYKHVKIIEDCAQSHGAMLGKERAGSLGDIATFSFYPTKNLGAMGDAGAITTNNESLSNKVKSLQQYGWGMKYHIDIPDGKNSRIDEMQAGILRCLLPSLDKWNKKRVDIYNVYKNINATELRFQQYGECDYVGHLAVVRTKQRDDFIKHMKSYNIATDIHYPVLDSEQVAWKDLSYRIESDLQYSKEAAQEVVSLPCFPTMTSQEIDHVCQALSEWKN